MLSDKLNTFKFDGTKLIWTGSTGTSVLPVQTTSEIQKLKPLEIIRSIVAYEYFSKIFTNNSVYYKNQIKNRSNSTVKDTSFISKSVVSEKNSENITTNLELLNNRASELGILVPEVIPTRVGITTNITNIPYPKDSLTTDSPHAPVNESSLNNSAELKELSEQNNELININTNLSTMNNRINNIKHQLSQQHEQHLKKPVIYQNTGIV
jgi:hypothetical protein